MVALNYESVEQALADNSPDQLKKIREKCRMILKNKPRNTGFLHLMGIIEFQLGHVDRSSKWIEKVLDIVPNSAELHCVYAKMLASQKKYAEAVIAYKRSIMLKPDYLTAYYGLGVVFHESGDDLNAVKAYNDALKIDPNCAEVLNGLGLILKNSGSIAESINCYAQAIAAKPDYPMPLNNLGVVWFSLGSIDAAAMLFCRALALKPDYPDALNNLGLIDYHKGAFEDSIAQFRKALTLQPEYPAALNNLGNALKDTGKLPEAITAYKQAIALENDCPDYYNNLAMALLAAGRFDEGWPLYEWRWKSTQLAGARQDSKKPLWTGEAAKGGVLLIRAEQGFGDTLQLCRYAPLAAARGLRVALEVQPALAGLMKSLPGVERVIAQGAALPDFDFCCPMMSLPAAFSTKLESIPNSVPYLAAPCEKIETWRNRLGEDVDKKLKVGLAWAGSRRLQSPDLAAVDRRRSINPDVLAPLMDVDGVRFYSLQKGGPVAPTEFGLTDLMDACDDFLDTAALIANLDLVISVDTAVVHLAGALGKPVWVLNRFDGCWRWLQDREDSPWYPTLRLFRQPNPGNWTSVVARIKNELIQLLTSR